MGTIGALARLRVLYCEGVEVYLSGKGRRIVREPKIEVHHESYGDDGISEMPGIEGCGDRPEKAGNVWGIVPVSRVREDRDNSRIVESVSGAGPRHGEDRSGLYWSGT